MTKTLVCDICDDHADIVRPLPPIFTDYGAASVFHGPARTIKCHEDNSRVAEAVKTPGNGAVLVVDAGASLRRAVVGGNIAAAAAGNGWAGIIVYGAIRDHDELIEEQIGIKALALIPVPTVKKNQGEADIEIEIEGVRIKPGDYVYADRDGVIICPRKLHED